MFSLRGIFHLLLTALALHWEYGLEPQAESSASYSTVPRNSQDRHCSEGRTDEDLGIIGGPDGPKDPTGRLDSVAGRFARHDWLYFAARIYRRQKESG